MAGFLALSLALHVLWLAIPMKPRTAAITATTAEPLTATLAPAPREKSAVATRHLQRGDSVPGPQHPATGSDAAIEATPPASATINLDAVFAMARGHARDAPPPGLDKPRLPVTVEAAIAKATQRDELIESRGANGEYITRTRNSRCVTPTYIPHFLEGKTMLTQCEALKG